MVENEQSFGEYLRQLIRDSGITQHKFYTELGIRKPYFYDILAGRTNPPPYPLQLKAMEILQASRGNASFCVPLLRKAAKDRSLPFICHQKQLSLPSSIIQRNGCVGESRSFG